MAPPGFWLGVGTSDKISYMNSNQVLFCNGVAKISVRVVYSAKMYSLKTFEKFCKIYKKFAQKFKIFFKNFQKYNLIKFNTILKVFNKILIKIWKNLTKF